MTVFTLKEKIREDLVGSVLNGKVFVVKKNSEDGRAAFIDLDTKKVILHTTEVTSIFRDGFDMTINTISGSKYKLVDVRSFIPTLEPESVVSDAEPVVVPSVNISDISVVFENRTSKHINYGDGFDMTEFEFNRDINEEEFREFLTREGYNLKPYTEWYSDYAKIEGSGKKWTYTWVRVYTD